MGAGGAGITEEDLAAAVTGASGRTDEGGDSAVYTKTKELITDSLKPF